MIEISSRLRALPDGARAEIFVARAGLAGVSGRCSRTLPARARGVERVAERGVPI